MAHYCICSVCGIKFDRDRVQAVKSGARRYAHIECFPEGEIVPLSLPPSDDPDLATLKEYIANLYGDKANWALINKQIKKFHKENGYSYSGILKSLVYFYEIKHNSVENSNGGIGIVEYTYQAAYQYYLAIFMAQQNTENKTLFTQIKEFIIKPSKPQGTKKRVISWFDEEESNGD